MARNLAAKSIPISGLSGEEVEEVYVGFDSMVEVG
jgi:hypothetical protein